VGGVGQTRLRFLPETEREDQIVVASVLFTISAIRWQVLPILGLTHLEDLLDVDFDLGGSHSFAEHVQSRAPSWITTLLFATCWRSDVSQGQVWKCVREKLTQAVSGLTGYS
jgi:hypothetical protein